MSKIYKDSERIIWRNNDTKQVNVKIINGPNANEHIFYNPLGKRGVGEQGYAGPNSPRKKRNQIRNEL